MTLMNLQGQFSDFVWNKCSLLLRSLLESWGDLMKDDIADDLEWRWPVKVINIIITTVGRHVNKLIISSSAFDRKDWHDGERAPLAIAKFIVIFCVSVEHLHWHILFKFWLRITVRTLRKMQYCNLKMFIDKRNAKMRFVWWFDSLV